METLTVKELKCFCRAKRIKNYSKLTKKELVDTIKRYVSAIRIQRWIRKKLSKEELCPVSMESIKYPCFAYFPKKNVIIYYNVKELKDYLITTGDFRDPSTRNSYTPKELEQLDTIDKYYERQFGKKEKTKSVLKASTNFKFYKRQKQHEMELLTLERMMDDIIEEMFNEVINDKERQDRRFVMETVFLLSYRFHFRRLIIRDKEYAKNTIQDDINGLQIFYEKVKDDYDISQRDDHTHVIHWLYQLMEELYLNYQ